jgi:hypothetical protein
LTANFWKRPSQRLKQSWLDWFRDDSCVYTESGRTNSNYGVIPIMFCWRYPFTKFTTCSALNAFLYSSAPEGLQNYLAVNMWFCVIFL